MYQVPGCEAAAPARYLLQNVASMLSTSDEANWSRSAFATLFRTKDDLPHTTNQKSIFVAQTRVEWRGGGDAITL